MAIPMKEWLENELYTELRRMPLWTAAAFGNCPTILESYDSRYKLIIYLVEKLMDKVPDDIRDEHYKDNWPVSDFIDCVIFAAFNST